jgi:hypothetical protein
MACELARLFLTMRCEGLCASALDEKGRDTFYATSEYLEVGFQNYEKNVRLRGLSKLKLNKFLLLTFLSNSESAPISPDQYLLE